MFKKINRFFFPSQIIYSLVLFILMVIIFFIYRDIDHSFNTVEKEYLELQSQDIESFSRNISEYLQHHLHFKNIDELKKDPECIEKISNLLALFSTKHYRFIYILYLDDMGKLRYFADGSYEKSQRGIFGQKFDPESNVWKKALEENKIVHVQQHTFTDLWSTYYCPLNISNQYKLLLVFDISLESLDNFRSILLPFRNLLRTISIILVFLFIMSLIWSVLFYLQRKKATIDPLTRLYNRNMLYDIKKHIKIQKTSVILVDLDHFKRINDRYGHDAGDIVLQSTARALMRATRSEDILIRYGGEEFLILIKGITNKESLRNIAQRIQDEFLKTTIRYKEYRLKITASMGIVTPNENIHDLSEMITIADKMLYVAKTTGRNKYVLYNEEETKKKRILLYQEALEAIENDGIYFLYQPIYDAQTLKVVKFEILARLQDENGHMYSPDEFIHVIRGTTAYRELSKKLIRETCEKMIQYDIELSINFDINDFMDETLFEELYDMLQQYKHGISKLTIELLEETPVENLTMLIAKIDRLKKMGINIAIDDFGKGYAGLNYILNFRPHLLKIDRIMVSQIFTHPYMSPIVDSIIITCRQIGIKTVAEGIEDEKTLQKMQDVGFDFLQGYYLSKPLPWEEAKVLI